MPLTKDAQQVCERRYFQKDKDGKIIENWDDLTTRVVNYVCKNEDEEFKNKIHRLLLNAEFLPNSPCLVNAGISSKTKGLLACFVTKPPADCWSGAADSQVGMIENIANFGHVARQGGGAGVDFSQIRPENDPVFGSTHAKACGPIEHMRMISEVMSSITQSGFRGMAMLGALRVDHPDIEKFIVCKQHARALKTMLKEDIFNHFEALQGKTHEHLNIVLDKFIHNFNISVFSTDNFMQKVKDDEEMDLIFNDKIYKTIKARKLFDMIVESAWKNGDPGMLFYDTINAGPYKYSKQEITATNPCFQGDSMIAVADGRNFVSIQQLAKEGKDIPVYCADPETGSIHIRLGRNPRKTRTNASLCKVTFDDGGTIVTTPDHKICLRNGVYTKVKDLSSGDSVMTMTKFEYISHRSGYYGIVKGDGQPTKPEHRMINEFHEQSSLSSDQLIHHRDFNGINNYPNNLERMTFSEHSAYHRQFNNPMTHWYPNTTPEEKQRYHDNMSAATNGEKNGMYGKLHSDETKQKIGAKSTDRCKDGAYRQRLSNSASKNWTNDRRSISSERAKRNWKEGKYDALKSELVTKTCEWCGKEFSRIPSLSEELRFCGRECGNQMDISDEEIIDNAGDFVKRHGVYPSVSTWEAFNESVCSKELIRTRFGNFQMLSEKLIDLGIFAGISPNTKMTPKMISAALVKWTVENGKEPSRKEVLRDICSKQSLTRNGGYTDVLSKANELCNANSVNHKIVSVEMLDNTEDVFNITVDDYHNLCILSSHEIKPNSGKQRRDVSRYRTIVYKNCGEQPLPSWGSCNLGSIDVSKFYNEKRECYEWSRLRDAIETAVQFLDNVIDVNKFPTTDFAKWAKENRPVGLGIMGWADLLLKMGITYGDEESLKLAHKLGKFFQEIAHNKSVTLGKERGTPKACKYDELEYRRNVTTLTVAPTGTISIIAGCSSSIEPIFSATTHRYDNTGYKEIKHPMAWRTHFRCASDLSWKEHIGMQSAFQPYIDSAISKTINMSNEATRQDVADAYMYAWKSGCKGITIYRDGCKTTQVLNATSQAVVGANHAKPRPKEVIADIFKTRADGFDWHVIVGKLNDVPYEIFAVNGKQELPKSARVIKKKRRHYSLVDNDDNVLIENIGEEENQIHNKIGLETRRFSLELRHNIDPKFIVETIDKSDDVVTSFSKAVSRIMKSKYMNAAALTEISIPCPDCARNGRQVEMVAEAGCWKCLTCHFSRCG